MAKNLMADVAKLLGVELGEEFNLRTAGHILEMGNWNGGYDKITRKFLRLSQ